MPVWTDTPSGGSFHQVLFIRLYVRSLKEASPGTLLLFEVGYKYRCNHMVYRKRREPPPPVSSNARIASKVLGIARLWIPDHVYSGVWKTGSCQKVCPSNRRMDRETYFITPTSSSRWVIVYVTEYLLLGNYLTETCQVGIVGQTETGALRKASTNRESFFTHAWNLTVTLVRSSEVTELYTATMYVFLP